MRAIMPSYGIVTKIYKNAATLEEKELKIENTRVKKRRAIIW